MADDDAAAGEVLERFLERRQRLGVEIVGRLVEQQDIGARLQHLGEMHPVALAARQGADLLLLVAALEVEGAGVGARIHLALAERQHVVAAGDLLPHRLVGVEGIAALVDIAEMDAVADADGAAIRLLLAGQHAEQRRLAGAVRADHPDNAAGRQGEVQVLDQQPVVIGLAQILDLDDRVAEPLARRDDDLRAWSSCSRSSFTLQQFVIGLDARLRLGLPRLGRGRDPLLLALEDPLARRILARFLGEALGLFARDRPNSCPHRGCRGRDRARESSR